MEATDLLGGQTLSISAASVIDATGATGGPGGPFAADAGAVAVMPSLGVHLVVERDRIPAGGGLTIQIPGRVLFLIPWGRRWIIGTTDDPYDGPADRPAAPDAAVDEVLANVNDNLDVGLTRADILATYAGVRPLAATRGLVHGHGVPRARHRLAAARPGHRPRRQVHDVSAHRRGRRGRGARVTRRAVAIRDREPAPGRGPGTGYRDGAVDAAAGAPAAAGVIDGAALAALRSRYGTETDAVIALGAERGLLGRLHPDADHLEVEVAWAVERELALGLDDILARRLRLSIETRDHGASVAARAAAIVGPALGWDDARQAAEVARYTASAAVEYGVP